MRLKHHIAGLLICLALCPWATPAAAQQTEPVEVCRVRVLSELSSVHDEYRAVLFGSREDDDGKWISNTGGEVSEEITGIFETRYHDTHELIWPLVESYRVMRCRSLYVCETMQGSFLREEGNTDDVNLDLLGCEARTSAPYQQCEFANKEGTSGAATLTTDCKQLVEDMLAMEQAVLRLAVAYDSGYRSALQFVGMTDWMMKDFPDRAFIPLRGMVNMLGRLYQIPCFMGQCDMPDNSDVQLPQGNSPLDPNNPNPDAPMD